MCNGQRSSGSILFLSFPQELIVKLAERTGGKVVRVNVPRLYEGLVRTDSEGRAFLVDSLRGGGQKHTFLFKYSDGKILLDDEKTTQELKAMPQSRVSITTESDRSQTVDEAVEFNPAAFGDDEAGDMPWVM